jgi:NAD(P)H dehydrogenase (quinone)
MKVLVVYSHPGYEGHNSAILQAVEKKLDSMEGEYEVLDLYKMEFDPVLRESEFGSPSKGILEIQGKIKNSDLIMFIYPVWWGSMPAMMKGFIDRVFSRGFAFKYDENGKPVGLLKGKRAIVFMTSGAPLSMLRLTLNIPKKLIHFGTLFFCGIKTKVYQIGGCRKFSEDRREIVLKTVEKAFSGL